MSSKQDCVRARTPTDLELKYKYNKTLARMMGVADDTRDRLAVVETEVKNVKYGTWLPVLNKDGVTYILREGWYQKAGKIITIGWKIEVEVSAAAVGIPIQITGVPYKPVSEAFGGGVVNSASEGWRVDTNGVVSASVTSCYPLEGGVVLMAGTICYTI